MRIVQAFSFEAAHSLPNVPAGHRCRNVHGHSYRVELALQGDVDPKTGFVVDFFDVESAFRDSLVTLDHHYLNDINGLANPTAENIATWIWDAVRPKIQQLALVRLFETPNCWAEYGGE
jgi:6-pyruvoyltetrahydropterin/6-carboxytetrahydropterin synthase